MAKITWTDRSDTATDGTRNISASIFNDTKTSVNSLYDTIEAQLGTTSSNATASLHISGTIYVSGNIVPNTDGVDTTSSFDLGSPTAAWGEIYVATSSINFVDADGSITKWSKSDVVNLKAGKSLSTVAGKQLVNENDDTTYVRMSTAGRAVHYAGGNAAIDIKSDKVTLGGLDGASTGLPVSMPGGFTASSGASITGSVNITGSSVYTTTDLLTLLGNFGQTGSFAVTGSSSFTGDVNMDGTVTTQDLLTVVAGMNTTGSVNVTGSTEITGSVGILPPPQTNVLPPDSTTLFYGYGIENFNTISSPAVNTATLGSVISASPNASFIIKFAFSTASQENYNLTSSLNQAVFFSGLAESSSAGQDPILTFNPIDATTYYSASYKYTVTNVINSGSYWVLDTTFTDSSSIFPGESVTSAIYPTSSTLNGRFNFVIPPPTPPTGGFTVGDILNVLSTFGQTGVPVGSLGDYNFDGAVNIADLLLVLSGYGNPNNVCSDILVAPNTNHQLIGPEISICEGNFLIISTGSYCSITF